jgi:anti-sigma regulatory factor (Ser/Thr protein kinase)
VSTTIRLSPDPGNVRKARIFVAEQLRSRFFPEDAVEGAVLCTSELVTNVFFHARTDVAITVRTTDDVVRVEVSDGTSVLPGVRNLIDPAASSGRGLHLVESLAKVWAVRSDESGKTVWFEVER